MDSSEIEKELQIFKGNSDQFFLITMGTLVFFMQCGFAFLEAGSVRSKNTTNILIKNVLDVFIGALAYWLFGYAFAFGSEGNPFIGEWNFALSYLASDKFSHWFFQFVFAATSATIVSGAMAERTEFKTYLIYSIFLTGFIYPVVSHWGWDEHGWLYKGVSYTEGNTTVNITYMGGGSKIILGDTVGENVEEAVRVAASQTPPVSIVAAVAENCYRDFAGSGVVHVVGGTCALVGAAILGARIGRFKDGKPVDIPGHTVPMTALGGFILFVGFLAFNGGSQGAISNAGDADAIALAVVNTFISGASGAITALLFKRAGILDNGKNWSLLTTINGGLTGMVAICAGCNVVYPYGAFVIGFLAGVTYMLWSWALLKCKIDDPLDSAPVHMGGGTWGLLAAPLFNKNVGILYCWDKRAFRLWGWNILGLITIMAWAGGCAFLMFGFCRLINQLRVPEDIEIRGLDVPKHGEPAYPIVSYGDGWNRQDEQALGPDGFIVQIHKERKNETPPTSANGAPVEGIAFHELNPKREGFVNEGVAF